MPDHPIELLVSDDLQRSRLTVFFRLLLAIPHIIWVIVWSVIVFLTAIVGWIYTLSTGRLPQGLHEFFSSYIRYVTQLTAYLTLAADPYPRFNGEPGIYPIDVTLPAEPERQSRWRTLFRLVLALPALLLATALGGGAGAVGSQSSGGGGSSEGGGGSAGGLLVVVAFLGWFASLVTGRMPRGLRDAAAYATGYRSQALAYLLLVTDRYPNADPGRLLAAVEPPAVHEVHVADSDDPRRSRVTVFFRLPLAIPHIVWLLLWTVLAVVAGILQWFVTLFRGRPAGPLHRFLSAWLRYAFHVSAFISLAANPFPGFTGAPGTYPLELALPAPGRQNRWKTAFRLVLAIPAFAVSAALGGLWIVAAILTWFVGLFLGRAPQGLHNLLVYLLRYDSQLYAYLYFVTDAYPHASPLEGAEPAEVPVIAAFDVA